jgi:hypothetical protein
LEDEAEDALDVLEEGIFDATAVLALPEKYRGRLRTTSMVERLIQEIRRREKVIRIFPNQASAWRLVGPCWPKNMKNGPPDGVTGRWTNSTSGGRSGPANTPKTCNRNHPIAPFNQPDRQCALHKKLDFVDEKHGPFRPLPIEVVSCARSVSGAATFRELSLIVVLHGNIRGWQRLFSLLWLQFRPNKT